MTTPRLHVVTDDAALARPSFVRDASALLDAAEARIALHVRGHGTAAARLLAITVHLAATARTTGATVLVNDRLDVALAGDAHGVQIGRRSVPVADARRMLGAAMIGYSAHDVNEACAATAAGADFVLVGAIWETASHPGRQPAGTQLIETTVSRSTVPVIAIGGITPDRVAQAARAGAAGVAVLSGIWETADPLDALKSYLRSLDAFAD